MADTIIQNDPQIEVIETETETILRETYMGPQGLTGPTGPQGLTGPDGLIGLTGPTGLTGLTGLIGLTGPQGLTGPRGLTGMVGPTGLTGLTGSPGVTGPQGVTGQVNKLEVMGAVVHDSTDDMDRPLGYTIVTWLGTVAPLNAVDDDLWIDKT